MEELREEELHEVKEEQLYFLFFFTFCCVLQVSCHSTFSYKDWSPLSWILQLQGFYDPMWKQKLAEFDF